MVWRTPPDIIPVEDFDPRDFLYPQADLVVEEPGNKLVYSTTTPPDLRK